MQSGSTLLDWRLKRFFAAEKALATLQGRPIPELTQTVPLLLSPYPSTNPPTPLPPPSAQPRLVKQLPPNYTDSQLYDLFREFGALASARVNTQYGPDTGIIEFWNENDARAAEEAMHCAEVEGQNIVVQVYQPPRRTSASFGDFNPAAAAFVPGGSSFYSPYPNQYSPHSPHSPPRGSPYHSRSPLPGSPYLNKSPLPSPIPFVHGPGQQVQYAGSGSHSGLIDPCNLFCKVRICSIRDVPYLTSRRISIPRSIPTVSSPTSADLARSSVPASCATRTATAAGSVSCRTRRLSKLTQLCMA